MPVRAGDARPALRTELDRLVALQRDGGWTYWSRPGERPQPLSFGLATAERLAAPLGLATWDTIVLRSPGTPLAGSLLLAGHRLLGEPAYLAAARRAGDLLLALELPGGGWFSETPAEDGQLPPWFPWIIPGPALDDDVTPGVIRFLLQLWQATGDPRYRGGAERGVELLLAAQLPSGAWPLCVRRWWVRRLRPGYEDLATINDGATPFALETLLMAADALGRPALREPAVRAGAWLATVRGAPPRAGWAQQYDAAGRLAAGRVFEPPALASWETRHALEALLALAATTGEARWCVPVAGAAGWLGQVALRPGCWARFYALDTGGPLYVAADGRLVPDVRQARPGYSWQGDFGLPALLARLGTGGAAGPALAPGDPGTCPGERPVGVYTDLPDDPRTHAARAAVLVAEIEPPPPASCRVSAVSPRSR